MSKLLDEAKENRDKALSEAKRSHGDGERGLYSAWQENDNLVAAIWVINGHGDKNAIPALRKFLSEVE